LGGQASVPGAAGTWKGLTDNVNQLAANLTTQVRAIAEVATAVTKGDLTRSIKVEAQGEVAALKDNINEMIVNLKDTTLKNSEQDWLKTNLAKFSRMLQGQKDMIAVGRLILSELAPLVSAQHAVMYTYDNSEDQPSLKLLANYAYENPDDLGNRLRLGQGLVGQCALEKQKIMLSNVPTDYIRISSGLGSAPAASMIVLPIVFEGQVKAVLELASFERFNPTHQAFLDQLTESIGIVLNTIEANMRTEDLLKQSQSLAHELQSRQEELQQTNEELQEKARLLAHQNVEVERKNSEVEQARQALEEKAEQLAVTSKYKSEFLANMSHELRTPLNSLLILSDQLSKNPDGNLSSKQTEYAKTIHSSGNDLLMLINDILDISKIESGTVVLDIGELRFADLHNYVERTFRHVAEAKSVGFNVQLDSALPRALTTDSKRLQQVIKNLLSNAFKFTHEGQVNLKIELAHASWHPESESLKNSDCVIAISVSDTGIGIPQEKQHIIFEAFQQADGSTSRKYGGTGLGLAISREIARLLGGEIGLISQSGVGSTFTLYLPQTFVPQKATRRSVVSKPKQLPMNTDSAVLETETDQTPSDVSFNFVSETPDDRHSIQASDRVVLIVDNDIDFARFVLETAHKIGFKGITTPLGAGAVALAGEYQPQAILLDISLPDIDGWHVLERLKKDLSLQHIPVFIVSTTDQLERGLKWGAQGILPKPIQTGEVLEEFLASVLARVERTDRRIVQLETDLQRREHLAETLNNSGVTILAVGTGSAVLEAIKQGPVDAVVLNPKVSDMTLAVLVEQILSQPEMEGRPIVLQWETDADSNQVSRWQRLAHEFNLEVCDSPSCLLQQLVRSLCIPVGKLSNSSQKLLLDVHDHASVLAGKKVLIVDDDIRNIFALTSILECYDMVTVSAETGRDAINLLHAAEDVDIVLMDIMMPEMDGLDTTRAIRQISKFRNLPIVAVTAKAMKGDREKCIEAGAWDYLSKPVDPEQMLGVLRAWLSVG
jgi:signal transduction histidine kinase/DNA-binding response OmpR family regulator/HAMP domain-containing protein